MAGATRPEPGYPRRDAKSGQETLLGVVNLDGAKVNRPDAFRRARMPETRPSIVIMWQW